VPILALPSADRGVPTVGCVDENDVLGREGDIEEPGLEEENDVLGREGDIEEPGLEEENDVPGRDGGIEDKVPGGIDGRVSKDEVPGRDCDNETLVRLSGAKL